MAPRVRALTEDDVPELVRIRNQAEPHQLTVEAMREVRARRDPAQFRREWAAEAEGKLVAYASLQADLFIAGHVIPFIKVDAGYRRRGAGSALWAVILEARPESTRPMNAFVADDDEASRAWAERRGFQVHARRFRSVLRLADFDAAAFPAPPPGVAFEPAGWDRAWAMVEDLLPQAPDGLAAPTRRWFDEEIALQPGAFALAAVEGGVDLGLVVLHPIPPTADGRWYNFFTGLVPAARGRGIALPLKVASTVEAVRRGAAEIATNNLSVNEPMLAVNRRLGYRPERGVWWLRRAPTSA